MSKVKDMFNPIQWLKCKFPWPFYGHDFEVIETYDQQTRKLKCTACGKYFTMSDRHMAILPWDEGYEELTCRIYGIPRTKI